MPRGFTDADVSDQSGKIFLVTGANTGIGFETARVLALRGARVLLGCRSRTKAEAAVTALRTYRADVDVDVVELDLGSLASVAQAAERVHREPRLDGLVNNAGVMMPPRQVTIDGFELQFGVNHLGHFALTSHLLPLLEQTANARIVNTSSNGHRFGDIYFKDLMAERFYERITRYGMSKLANLLHTYELDRRLRAKGSSTRALAVHPGGSDTELFRHFPKVLQALGVPLLRPFMNTAAQGAWPTLMASTAPQAEGGRYYGPGGLFQLAGPAREVRSNRKSRDTRRARRLWDVSVELTGVDPGL